MKANVYKEVLIDYRLVSNWPFLTNIFERVVVHQSVYRETALLEISYDIAEDVDNKFMATLIRLDLSNALHVIDRRILHSLLEYSFRVNGSALSLSHAYISDRIKCVTVGRSTSVGK